MSALQWRDIDFEAQVIRFRRKQVKGIVGAISKKKPVPREIPMLASLAETLVERRRYLERLEYPVDDSDWVFPSRNGKLKTPASLVKAIRFGAAEAGVEKHLTPHKLRYFFNDLLRLAGIDKVARKALTGHVTDEMTERYSTVDLDEKRAAMKLVAKRLDEEKVALWVAPRSKTKKAA